MRTTSPSRSSRLSNSLVVEISSIEAFQIFNDITVFFPINFGVMSETAGYWCDRNRNNFYIPEWLLDEWGFRVHDDLAGAA
jgi:hypothetical protein